MAVVPDKRLEKVQFYENHISDWTTNATAIGLVTGDVTEITTKTTTARTAYDAHQAAQNAAKMATQAYYAAVEAMAVTGAALIKKIRGKAEQVGGTSVYTFAGLPAPATPTPVGAPGTPEGFTVTLRPNGTLELLWKCSNPTGCNNVIYQVYRKVESTGTYEYIGGTGSRKFVDNTVPSSVPSVMYQIQGTRSTGIGVAGEFVVNFGVNSSGTMTASVGNTPAPAKIAA